MITWKIHDGVRFWDLTGRRVGHLTVVGWAGMRGRRPLWEASCDCGGRAVYSGTELLRKRSKHPRGCGRSCPLLAAAIPDGKKFKHGKSKTREYIAWMSMRVRCYDQTDKDFKNYGGRGILVCPRWESFKSFWEDMSAGYRDDLELDRVDVNGNYCPENCRWVTRKENSQNRRNSWARRGCPENFRDLIDAAGLRYETVTDRLRRGQTWGQAISTPSRRKHNTQTHK